MSEITISREALDQAMRENKKSFAIAVLNVLLESFESATFTTNSSDALAGAEMAMRKVQSVTRDVMEHIRAMGSNPEPQ